MFYEKRLVESLEKKYSLKENIENVYKNCQIIENENGLYSIIYKGIEVADNFKNKRSAKIAIDQEMKIWPNDPWGQGMLDEDININEHTKNVKFNEDYNESNLDIGKIRLLTKSGVPLSLSNMTDEPMKLRDMVEDAKSVNELINKFNRAGFYYHNFNLDRETPKYIRLTCKDSYGNTDYLVLTKKNSSTPLDDTTLKIRKIHLTTESGIPEALSNMTDEPMKIKDIIENAKSAQEIVNKINRSSNVYRKFRLDRETSEYIRLEGKDGWGNTSYLILTKEKPEKNNIAESMK